MQRPVKTRSGSFIIDWIWLPWVTPRRDGSTAWHSQGKTSGFWRQYLLFFFRFRFASNQPNYFGKYKKWRDRSVEVTLLARNHYAAAVGLGERLCVLASGHELHHLMALNIRYKMLNLSLINTNPRSSSFTSDVRNSAALPLESETTQRRSTASTARLRSPSLSCKWHQGFGGGFSMFGDLASWSQNVIHLCLSCSKTCNEIFVAPVPWFVSPSSATVNFRAEWL